MDMSRLRRSDRVIGGSAIALFIFMFLFKWYGFSYHSPLGSVTYSANGWNTFHNSRWLWLITIIAALLLVAVDGGLLKIESPVHPGAIVTGLGALSTIFILYRIFDHPSGSASYAGVSASAGIKIGIWLGLIAAIGITYGGYERMRDDNTSFSDVRDQASAVVNSGSSEVAASPATAPAPAAAPAEAPMPPPAAEGATPPAAGEVATPPIPPPAADPPA